MKTRGTVQFFFNLQTVKKIARFCKTVDKYLLPLAITMNAIDLLKAVYRDYNYGTSRNTKETGVVIAGGWGGGYVGAISGAALGTLIFPGIGAIIGGVIGGLAGGIGGSLLAEKLVQLL